MISRSLFIDPSAATYRVSYFGLIFFSNSSSCNLKRLEWCEPFEKFVIADQLVLDGFEARDLEPLGLYSTDGTGTAYGSRDLSMGLDVYSVRPFVTVESFSTLLRLTG